jgi:hypothetical protein
MASAVPEDWTIPSHRILNNSHNLGRNLLLLAQPMVSLFTISVRTPSFQGKRQTWDSKGQDQVLSFQGILQVCPEM